jgi:hypothetical protein
MNYKVQPKDGGFYVVWHPQDDIDGKVMYILPGYIDPTPDSGHHYFPIKGFEEAFESWHCDCGGIYTATGECFNCDSIREEPSV